MKRAVEGDHDAFRVLVERYQDRAFGLALRVMRDEEQARDVVQDAFIKAYRSLDRFGMAIWLHSDKGGYGWEKVYDVALSDGREPGPKTGKVPPVGNTVNAEKATYTNDIGDTQLSAVWTDHFESAP